VICPQVVVRSTQVKRMASTGIPQDGKSRETGGAEVIDVTREVSHR